jgi:predicted AAA+ superfamily ATPase
MAHCLKQEIFSAQAILYLPCDEVYDASELSYFMTQFLDSINNQSFLLIIDEITFVKNWDRVIKSFADQGRFDHGICLLTGSDTLILKEAAMRFPGRRGNSSQTDFHISPLSFYEYVHLLEPENHTQDNEKLSTLFNQYLQCGGYLRAINDVAEHSDVLPATLQTYE